MEIDTITTNQTTPPPAYPVLAGSLPAKLIAAMAPVIRYTEDYRTSDYAWNTQKPILVMGTYLLPVSDGAVLMNTDGLRMVCLYEPTAQINQPVKLFLPDDLLEACTVKMIDLRDENGQSIPTEMRPRPGTLILHGFENHGLAVLSMHDDDRATFILRDPDDPSVEAESLVLGTWTDRSHGNVIDHTGFRLEPVAPKLMRAFAKQLQVKPTCTVSQFQLNAGLLADLMACAEAIGAIPLEMRWTRDGQAVEFTSVEHEGFWAVVMGAKAIMQVPEDGYAWRRELSAGTEMPSVSPSPRAAAQPAAMPGVFRVDCGDSAVGGGLRWRETSARSVSRTIAIATPMTACRGRSAPMATGWSAMAGEGGG